MLYKKGIFSSFVQPTTMGPDIAPAPILNSLNIACRLRRVVSTIELCTVCYGIMYGLGCLCAEEKKRDTQKLRLKLQLFDHKGWDIISGIGNLIPQETCSVGPGERHCSELLIIKLPGAAN